MIHSNKKFPYSRSQQHKFDTIDTFFSSVHAHDVTTTVELIVGTNTLCTDVYAIVSKLGLNITKVLQDRFRECGIPINIWYDKAQE